MKAGYNKPILAYHFPQEDTALRIGEIFPLLTIDKGFESDTERREFSQAIKRVDLEVRYESVYGDERTSRLEAFEGRTLVGPVGFSLTARAFVSIWPT